MADIPTRNSVDVSDDAPTKATMDIDMNDFDQTLKAHGETVLIQDRLMPEEDRRILRKIDLCMIPILVISYMFQYLDKSAMSYTAILGLRTDLHLNGQQYSWAGSLFNFGYLAASAPVALLMVRFPVGKFLSVSIITWASILMCTAATHDAAGLWACRFFLGFMEAAVAPGFSIITAMWYKRSEQPLRHGAWYMGNVISGFFAGPLSYAMGHVTSYPAWKLLFLVFGGVTLLWGILLSFMLPDTPATAWFLTKDDRVKAVERVQVNMTGIKNKEWKKGQMMEAFGDPKTWLTVIIMLSTNIPNGGVGNFAAIVIQGFGFSTYRTLLVQMICTCFQAIFVGIACIGSSYLPNTRTIFMAIMLTIGLIGACMIRQINNHHIWARFMGYCFLSAYTSAFPLTLSLNAANYGGFTKKTTVNAMVFIAYCVGNIIGPQLFFAREAPSYPSGFAAMLVCFSVAIVATLAMRSYLIWENRRRDRRAAEIGEVQREYQLPEAVLNLVDKTDIELLQFRYVY